jgi:hypothetical protein
MRFDAKAKKPKRFGFFERAPGVLYRVAAWPDELTLICSGRVKITTPLHAASQRHISVQPSALEDIAIPVDLAQQTYYATVDGWKDPAASLCFRQNRQRLI